METTDSPVNDTTDVYDADGRICWSYVGSTNQSPTACTSPPASSTTTHYEADLSVPLSVTGPTGVETTYSYNDPRYPTKATEVESGSQSASPIFTYTNYDNYANACVAGPNADDQATPGTCTVFGGDTYDVYDVEGQLMSSTDGIGATTNYQYTDAAFPDLAHSVTIPHTISSSGITTYAYDADGNETSTTDPELRTTSMAYDVDGQLCATVPANLANTQATCGSLPSIAGASTYTYNPADERIVMQDSTGSSSTSDAYTYDLSGNLLSQGNDNGVTTSYAYTASNQVSCVSYAAISSSSCLSGGVPSSTNSVVADSYNSLGQLASTQDWLGNTTSYGYNDLGEVQSVAYPKVGTTAVETVSYGYDPSGALDSMDYAGSVTVGSGTLTANQSYSPNGENLIGAEGTTSPLLNSYSSTNTYNPEGQLSSNSNPAAETGGTIGTQGASDAYSYWGNQEIESDVQTGGSSANFTYDAGNELSQMTQSPAGGSPVTTTSFAYTEDGQRCGSSTSSTLSALCSGMPSGSTGYQYNTLGQLCWTGTTTSTAPTCSDGSTNGTSLAYDGDGLLTSSTSPSGSASYTFNTQSSSTPLMLSDGTSSYVYGPSLFGGTAPVEQITGSSVDYLAAGPSGVQAVFTGGSGATIQEEAAYSAFGTQVLGLGRTSPATPFGYDGAYTISSMGSGLLYLDHRYYDRRRISS